MIGNIVWLLLAGWWLALGHVVTAILLAVTIVGIPFAWAHEARQASAVADREGDPCRRRTRRSGSRRISRGLLLNWNVTTAMPRADKSVGAPTSRAIRLRVSTSIERRAVRPAADAGCRREDTRHQIAE